MEANRNPVILVYILFLHETFLRKKTPLSDFGVILIFIADTTKMNEKTWKIESNRVQLIKNHF